MRKAAKGLLTSLSLLLIALPAIFLLTGCTPVTQEEVIDALLPNLWVFITHVFATVVLLILAIWLVWRPTKASLQKRHEYIQTQITTAEDARKKALAALDEAEKTKIQAFNTAQEIVSNAKKEAYNVKQRIESDANYNASIIKENANNEAEKIKAEMKKQMHEQVIDLAFAASSALLKNKITKEDSDQFVDEFISELEEVDKKKEVKK